MGTHMVYVGMSGGVDSSVAAALLLEQGYGVTGVYMKNWTLDLPGMRCPWADDLADAKRVAVQLGIPFKVFDFQNEYKQKVVDYMIAEYAAGRTPNPDVMCNQEVKFRLFLDTALEDGAEFIATGHYARRVDGQKQTGHLPSTIYHLLMSKDTTKDQTYFLYRITQNALAHTLFPLGGYTKQEVRAMAAERGLATADKKDSQGICFVGQVGIRDFLSQYVRTEPGDIVDHNSGDVIGRHDGAIFYTIGQRRGLGIGGGLPYYVTGKDMEKNLVYVTKKLDDAALWKSELRLTSIHWIEPSTTYHLPSTNLKARLRYRAPLIEVTKLEPIGSGGYDVALAEPQRAVTPGQSAVFYRGDAVLGGGIVM